MAAVAGLLAGRLGTSPSEAWMIRTAASLHDVGKLTVGTDILKKPGSLSVAERAAVERHAVAGHRMLSGSEGPIFRLAATIALTHHEHWDGGGYPFGLREEEIPLAGRIAAVADVFDALLSERPYRAALGVAEALEVLQDGRGSHFDPLVIDALLVDLGGALAVRSGLHPVPVGPVGPPAPLERGRTAGPRHTDREERTPTTRGQPGRAMPA